MWAASLGQQPGGCVMVVVQVGRAGYGRMETSWAVAKAMVVREMRIPSGDMLIGDDVVQRLYSRWCC